MNPSPSKYTAVEIARIVEFCEPAGDNLYISPMSGRVYDLTGCELPAVIEKVEAVETPKPPTRRPRKPRAKAHKVTVTHRERIIAVDGSVLIHLPGGDITEDEWHEMTHTVKDRTEPHHAPRHVDVPANGIHVRKGRRLWLVLGPDNKLLGRFKTQRQAEEWSELAQESEYMFGGAE